MKQIASMMLASLVLALPGVSHAAAPAGPVPTVEQLAAFPDYSSFTLSPDGRHLAALRARGEDRVIAVWQTDAMDKAPTLIGSQRMKIARVEFIKNDRLAVTLWQPLDIRVDGVTKTFANKLFVTDLEGRDWKEPVPAVKATSRAMELSQAWSSAAVLSALPNDPEHILVVNQIGSNAGDVYKVNLNSMRAERIQMSEPNVTGYLTDLDGVLRARARIDQDGTGAYVSTEFRNLQTGAWEEHFRSHVKDRNQFLVLGFAADPGIAFVASNQDREFSRIHEYDIAKRQMREVLYEHRFFNAAGISVNPFRNAGDRYGELIGVRYAGPYGDEAEWASPSMQALDAGLRQALGIAQKPLRVVNPATGEAASIDHDGERTLRITHFTPDYSTALLTVSGPALPPEYHLFHKGALTLLSKTFADIPTAAHGQTELVYYKARDGLDIPAFLTRPDQAMCGKGPWPAVVHPHGGPWARDSMDFDASMWTTLMASRCMAVLRPQFRGSDGWGRKLWMAGDAQWGKAMQDDKDDGAKWLVDQGVADPARIALFGFSYGGYAAFAASIRDNSPYKCAVAGAGVSDIKKIWSRYYTNPYFRQAQGKTVDGLNPVDHADRLSIPLMVYHGDRDQTVPIVQSEWFVNKAKAAGQPVSWHPVKDYGHGPSWTRATAAEHLGLLEQYLTTQCGGTGL